MALKSIAENKQSEEGFKEVGKVDPKYERRKLQKATRDFEALFVYQLLKTMRQSIKSVSDKSDFGFGQDVMMSVADQAVADKIADSDAFGISKLLMEHFESFEASKAAESESGADFKPIDRDENSDEAGSDLQLLRDLSGVRRMNRDMIRIGIGKADETPQADDRLD